MDADAQPVALNEIVCQDSITTWITMPDGVRLSARLWLPESANMQPVPAILEFLPYRHGDITAPRDDIAYPRFRDAGYAGVRVDIRGTGSSEGLFDDEYSESELSDAETIIAWIAAQPWCSGQVGMMGISWGGFNALQVAARRPKALKAVISIGSTVDRFADDIHYKGGAQLAAQLSWATNMLALNARPPDSNDVGPAWREMWLQRLEGIEPLIGIWLRYQDRGTYWRHGSICEDFSAVDMPAFVISGWADGYRNTPTLANAGLGENCASPHGDPGYISTRTLAIRGHTAISWLRPFDGGTRISRDNRTISRIYTGIGFTCRKMSDLVIVGAESQENGCRSMPRKTRSCST